VSAWPLIVDGREVEPGAPAVAADDAGLLLGLAAFETLLVEDGHAYFLDRHLERLRGGAEQIGISWPPPRDVRADVARALELLGSSRAALRLTLTRGAPSAEPCLIVGARAVEPPRADGVAVAVSGRPVLAGEPLANLKLAERTAYVLAREEAWRAGAWEALVPTNEGDLAEGTISNLFALLGGELVTPDTSRACLPGVTRAVLLESLGAEPLVLEDGRTVRAREGRVERADLARAKELLLTNSTGGVIGVREVLGERSGLPGAAGSSAKALSTRLASLEHADRP
jgi:branched-chain amino acid aminotransferase